MMENQRALMVPSPMEATGQEEEEETRMRWGGRDYDNISREEGWMRGGMKNNGCTQNYSTNHNLPSTKMHPNLYTMASNDKRTEAVAYSKWRAVASNSRWTAAATEKERAG